MTFPYLGFYLKDDEVFSNAILSWMILIFGQSIHSLFSNNFGFLMTAVPKRSKATRPQSKKYKVVLLGNAMCGKTTFISRFLYSERERRDIYQPTVGIDFLSKTVRLEDESIRLQLWDTAGQERFRSLIPSYIRDCSIAFILFDVTCAESFSDVKSWFEQVDKGANSDVITFIIGNKMDLEDARKVSPQEGEALAEELGAFYSECSAQSGLNVHEIFNRACSLLPKSLKPSSPNSVDVTLSQNVDSLSSNTSCAC